MVVAGTRPNRGGPPGQPKGRRWPGRGFPFQERHSAQNQSLEPVGPVDRQMHRHPPPEGMTYQDHPICELVQDRLDGPGIAGGADGDGGRWSGAKTRQVEGNEREPLE